MSRTLYEMMNDIDDDIILDAEKLRAGGRGRLAGFMGAAAAACLALAIIPFALSGGNGSPDIIFGPERTEQTTQTQPEQTSTFPDSGSVPETPPMETVTARFNSAEPGLGGSMLFNLSGEDYVTMPWEELFGYYPADISYDELVASFQGLFPEYSVRQSDDPGIYVRGDGTPYYDTNTVVFDNSNGGSIGLTFANAFIMGADMRFLGEHLEFTEINGRQQVLFCYTDESGSVIMYTEFLRGDTGVYISAGDIPEEDFVRAVSELLPPAEEKREHHSFEGELIAIDSYAQYIAVRCDEGSCGVYLPEGEAEKYSLYDRVKVTYTGEPAQIRSIWRQQLEGIELV